MSTSAAPITVYTTSWCGYCRRLTSGLAAAKIGFTEVDVDHDDQAATLVSSLNAGNRTVPTVVFADGSSLTNPQVDEVAARIGH